MDTKRWLRVKEIFLATVQREPHERAVFLDEACGHDQDLRREVEVMLSSYEDSKDFLELPTKAALLPDEQKEPPSFDRIGPYLIQKVISAGGMGTVYEALQESPIRTVAVKVMSEGIASKTALRRFEYESQILASLKHPNIAQVIEAGTHRGEGRQKNGGMPYFVMEYIEGARAVTDFAREKKLGISERMKLFLPVCDAVHHGHQRGIIHRDLKPSNLLVDASGKVKIIDFGVARATDSDLALTTANTDVGQLIGTLQYMSPEQCRADPNDLDIRSDVYALGVVLYELLCEELPYDVRKAVVFEATRVIREAQPKRPSTTKRALRGDAETIVLKALEKERARRYQTVADLGADIRRFLNGEVILAKPAGPATRAWKRARRHPVLSTALGVALFAALTFLGYILFVSYPQIRHERDVAEEKKKLALAAEQEAVKARNEAELQYKAALLAKAETEKEAETTKEINEFLEEMLSSADPFKEGGSIELVGMLERAAERIEKEFPNRPEIEASLRNTIGETFLDLGRYKEAEVQLKKAVENYQRVLGQEHLETLRAKRSLSDSILHLGRLSEAEFLSRETLETLRRAQGEEHPVTLRSMYTLAGVLFEQGEFAKAESLIRKTLNGQLRVLNEEHIDTLNTMVSLGTLLFHQGEYDEAESILRATLRIQRRVLDDEHPLTLISINNLSDVLKNQGKYSEAESILQETLETSRRVLGEEHPYFWRLRNNLADLYNKQGRYSEAETIIRKVIATSPRVLDEEHEYVLQSKNVLAIALKNQGMYSEAESIFRENLEVQRRTLGEEHWKTLVHKINLANLLLSNGKPAEAEPIYREMHGAWRRTLGENHPKTLRVMSNLSCALLEQGKYSEAERISRKVWESRCRELGEGHPDTILSLFLLARSLQFQEKISEAESLFHRGVGLIRESGMQEHPMMACYLVMYGKCLMQLERYEEAEQIMLEGYGVLAAKWGDENENTKDTVKDLIHLYETWGKPNQATEWEKKPH